MKEKSDIRDAGGRQNKIIPKGVHNSQKIFTVSWWVPSSRKEIWEDLLASTVHLAQNCTSRFLYKKCGE